MNLLSPSRAPLPPTSLSARVSLVSWCAALGATAATYFYFLIFSEFALVETARAASAGAGGMRAMLLALGLGGIAGAALAGWRYRADTARAQLRVGFLACAVTALLTLLPVGALMLGAMAFLAGASLGGLTVVLAASLLRAAGPQRLGLAIGGGTGLAYAACNLPFVFEAPPQVQTLAAAGVSAVTALLPGFMGVGGSDTAAPASPRSEYTPPAVARWVSILLALVWLDSAAFFIIQHTPALRAASWHGAATLAGNAFAHFAAAVAAGFLLDRGFRGRIAAVAVSFLALACLALEGRLGTTAIAPWLYTAGVSLYSTVLVEYPARSARPHVAALVYIVAGWIGSALGIGMAQDLHRIPTAFVVLAIVVVVVLLWGRRRALRRAALATACFLPVVVSLRASETGASLITRGREVYIAEGCIHCHSQFIRPLAPGDVARWGPATTLADALSATPPLFGTRRQGPDLSHVGNRRSAEWNRLHLISPRVISPGSRMPSYAHLFSGGDARGDALVAYLASLGADTLNVRLEAAARWLPSPQDVLAPPLAGALFARLCAHCHGPAGHGDGPLAHQLSVRPPDWSHSPWRHVRADADIEPQLSRIIKFGLPGLPMAGHEYLPDGDVVGLARFVRSLHTMTRRSDTAAVQP